MITIIGTRMRVDEHGTIHVIGGGIEITDAIISGHRSDKRPVFCIHYPDDEKCPDRTMTMGQFIRQPLEGQSHG